MKKLILIAFLGFFEQSMYTLYLISVNRYLINISSLLMLLYMTTYLFLIDKMAKDKKDSLRILITYASACAFGNWITMALRIIK